MTAKTSKTTYLLIASVPIIWGLTPTVMKTAFDYISPFFMSFLRLTVAFLTSFVFLYIRGKLNIRDIPSVIPSITPAYGNFLINDGIVSEGMIPKVKNCINALYSGIESVHIINGTIKNILEQLELNLPVGTTFYIKHSD